MTSNGHTKAEPPAGSHDDPPGGAPAHTTEASVETSIIEPRRPVPESFKQMVRRARRRLHYFIVKVGGR